MNVGLKQSTLDVADGQLLTHVPRAKISPIDETLAEAFWAAE